MRENFQRSFDFILHWEGDYSFDKDDPGGETRWGISKRAYPDKDIKNLLKEDAKFIYLDDYWIRAGCDLYQWPFDMIAFDTAVNQGVSIAKKFATEAESPFDFLMKRIARYNITAKNNPKFLRGWLNRVLDLYEEIK